MVNKNKLPDSFATEQDAGEFWDNQSLADFTDYLEDSDDKIEIKNRVFEVQIAEDVFHKLRQEAKSSHESLPKVVDQILRKELTSV
ncbi:hypothetical protein BH20ACI1_BH20ACI1_03510 [soil metagenome]